MKRLAVCVFVLMLAGCAWSADITGLEREGMVMRSELYRLGTSGDPFERETILRKIIDKCKGTEEGEAAYMDLADLYLDGFPDEMRKEACEMLELCLKSYPNTRRSTLVKCRLVDLYDAKDKRRAEIIKQLKNDSGLPTMIKVSLN